jgi:hypothetical protein
LRANAGDPQAQHYPAEAEAELGASVETVRKWRLRFTESGTAGLADARRPGRWKANLVLTGTERDELAWGRRR